MEQKGNGVVSQMGQLLSLNKLSYSAPMDGNLNQKRQYKKYNFTPLVYDGNGAPQIQINSGSDFCWGPGSAIVLTCQALAAGGEVGSVNASFGVGSAYNLFSEFEITHRSGDTLDKVRNVDSLVQTLSLWQNGADFQSYAQLYGSGAIAPDDVGTAAKTYVLPLSLFSGFFAQNAMIPSHLLAGSRMTLQLNAVAQALSDLGTGPANRVKITSMELLLDSFDLIDSAKKIMMSQAGNVKQGGLQYTYHSWFNINKTFQSTGFNFDVALSAAKTSIVLAKTRLVANLNDGTKDSMGAEVYPYSAVRLRVGSDTQPQFEITSPSEAYFITQNSFENQPLYEYGDMRHQNITVSFKDYDAEDNGAGIADGVAFKGAPCLAISMERNALLGLSGQVTNNSRLINLSGDFKNPSARQMDIYVSHYRVANVFLENVVVNK